MTDPLYPRHANSGPAPEVTPPERRCWICGRHRPAPNRDPTRAQLLASVCACVSARMEMKLRLRGFIR